MDVIIYYMASGGTFENLPDVPPSTGVRFRPAHQNVGVPSCLRPYNGSAAHVCRRCLHVRKYRWQRVTSFCRASCRSVVAVDPNFTRSVSQFRLSHRPSSLLLSGCMSRLVRRLVTTCRPGFGMLSLGRASRRSAIYIAFGLSCT